MPQPPQPPRRHAWTRIVLTHPAQLRQRLQQRHWVRLHALVVGCLGLLVMLGMSAGLRQLGVHSMALRYGVALLGGYGAYLLLLRLWVGCMLRRDWGVDVPDVFPGRSTGRCPQEPPTAMGVEIPAPEVSAAADGMSAVDGLSALDGEGIVLLPVLAVFSVLLLALTGMGSLLWLVWGSELFLAVAVEVAFALVMARSVYVLERDGWLLAALRLSWRPLLGALAAAVVLGLVCDVLFPEMDSLPQVLRSMRG